MAGLYEAGSSPHRSTNMERGVHTDASGGGVGCRHWSFFSGSFPTFGKIYCLPL